MFSPSLPFKKKKQQRNTAISALKRTLLVPVCGAPCVLKCVVPFQSRGGAAKLGASFRVTGPRTGEAFVSAALIKQQTETVRPALAAREGDCSVSGEREASASPRLAGRQLPIAQTRRAITDSCPTSPALHRQHQKDYCKLLFMVPHFIAERGLSDTSWK